MNKTLSIIAPMYNEEEIARRYCETTMNALNPVQDRYTLELVLVNDGSRDNTLIVMNDLQHDYPDCVTVVNLTRNFGLEGAIKAGLSVASGDIVVVMDADLQDPPAVILQMLTLYEEGYDIVVANRQSRKSDSLYKRATAGVYYHIMNMLSGRLKLEDNAANFRLLSRDAVNRLLSLSEVNSVFRVLVPFLGMRTGLVQYERDKRFAGETKYNTKSMFAFAMDGITSLSIKPLRWIILTLPIIALIIIICFVGLFLGDGLWRFFFAILMSLSVFFGMAFLCLYIIAEYIGQIMVEVKSRPTSLIQDYRPCKNVEGLDNGICHDGTFRS